MSFKSFEDLFGKEEKDRGRVEWFTIGVNDNNEAMQLQLKEMGSPEFKKLVRKMDRAIETSRRKPKKRARIWAEVLAKTVLLNWKNILDGDGKTVEPTYENRFQALVDHSSLMDTVVDMAGDSTLYDEDEEDVEAAEETEKNLKRSSAGRSNTPKTSSSSKT